QSYLSSSSLQKRITSGISPSFLGLSRSSRWVTHVLLTRSRLCPGASPGSSLHLHVLSTPPAFVLSQDQTLREVLLPPTHPKARRLRRAVMPHVARDVHDSYRGMTGFLSQTLAITQA